MDTRAWIYRTGCVAGTVSDSAMLGHACVSPYPLAATSYSNRSPSSEEFGSIPTTSHSLDVDM